MANLFSRVGLKNGDRAGEVLVQSRRDGDALHPRRGVADAADAARRQAAAARRHGRPPRRTSPTG